MAETEKQQNGKLRKSQETMEWESKKGWVSKQEGAEREKKGVIKYK